MTDVKRNPRDELVYHFRRHHKEYPGMYTFTKMGTPPEMSKKPT
jgi:hypothetical protein